MDPARLLERAYEAFNARDIEAALELMHPDVDWPNGWEGGRVVGLAGVRDYWTRQFAAIDSQVEPIHVVVHGPQAASVDVHQVVRDLEGNVLSDGVVRHVYSFRDGLVARMEIEEGDPRANPEGA